MINENGENICNTYDRCIKPVQVMFKSTGSGMRLPYTDTAVAAAKSLQSCSPLCDPRDGSPPGSPSLGFSRQEHWSGCHFLLQCIKVKSESEAAQSCPTLSNPMDCSPPGSSIHGIFQARVLEWGAIAFSDTDTSYTIFQSFGLRQVT